MGVVAGVAGASGYAGGELLRLLSAHPEIELGPITAHTHEGRPVGAVHPQLPALADRVFAPTAAEELASADVVFLALPHGTSAALAAALPDSTRVVDLGADHRLLDAKAWAAYYGSPHAGTWPYALPELPGARATLAGASRVAVPGCYPTAVALAVAPLLSARLVEPDDVVVVAASGTSGAGAAPTPALMASQVMGDVTAYKVGGVHQHTPEMEQSMSAAAGRAVRVSFTPLLAPMPRGLLATCSARLTPGTTTGDLRAALSEAYGDEPFVHLSADGQWPHTGATLGSNSCLLQAAADPHTGRAVVVSAIDNLGKGAAGQAVQVANLLLGLPEPLGLSAAGITP